MASRMATKRSKESGAGSNLETRRAGNHNAHRVPASGMTEPTIETIVEYTDQKQPKNLYPLQIISPVRSGPCCFTDMEEIGEPQENGRWVFRYKRCKKCGFALRVILREIPDAGLAAELRKILMNSFVRNVPE